MGVVEQCLKTADRWICRYLGLGKEETKPTQVVISKGKLHVQSNQSFKRHQASSAWQTYQNMNFTQTSPEHKEQLGVAVGKAMAEDFVVSFEQPNIQDVDHDQHGH